MKKEIKELIAKDKLEYKNKEKSSKKIKIKKQINPKRRDFKGNSGLQGEQNYAKLVGKKGRQTQK